MVIILPVGLNVVADRLNTDIKREILSWPLVSSTAGTRSIVNEERIYIHTYIHSYEFTHLGGAHSAEIDAASTSTIFIFTLSSEPSNFRGVLFEGSENSMLKPAFCTYIHYINQYLIHSTYIHTYLHSVAGSDGRDIVQQRSHSLSERRRGHHQLHIHFRTFLAICACSQLFMHTYIHTYIHLQDLEHITVVV